MVLKLYGHMISPPVRAVLMFAKTLELNLEFISIDLLKREHYADSFVKVNPRRTVPTLDDDGHIVWDSHAIMIYLAEKYGNNSPLYPTDLKKRSTINQILFFECGDIFAFHKFIAIPVVIRGEGLSPAGVRVLREGYAFIEKFLSLTKFVAGNEVAIADLSIWSTLSNSRNFVPLDENTYPNIIAWMKVMENYPFSEINIKGAAVFKKIISA